MAIKLTLGLVLADKLSSREEKYYFFSNFLERIYWLVYSHAIGIHGLFIQLAFFFFCYRSSVSLREAVLIKTSPFPQKGELRNNTEHRHQSSTDMSSKPQART